MSIEFQYDSALGDMLALLQEAVCRLIKKEPLDLPKFKHYFHLFNKRMTTLESQFHTCKLKFTKFLSKLQALCPSHSHNLSAQKQFRSTFSQHTTSFPKSLRCKGNYANSQSYQMSVRRDCNSKYRSGTADVRVRPIISEKRQRQTTKRQSKSQNQKKIIFDTQRYNLERKRDKNRQTKEGSDALDCTNYEKNSRERKDFYDELASQHCREYFLESEAKIPPKVKKNVGQHRWSFKINKLF